MFIWKELDALDHIYGGRVNDQPRDKCMLQVHKATLIGLPGNVLWRKALLCFFRNVQFKTRKITDMMFFTRQYYQEILELDLFALS